MDSAPVLPPPRPLFCNIHHRQIQHFQQTVVCRENALGFCDLPQLPIKSFNRVRGIDQTADFLRILEVSTEVGSVFPPRLCNLGIFAVPVLRKSLQSIQSSLLVHGGIHGLQIGHESLQVFVRDIFAGIPQLVNNAVLNLRFRKYCVDGCIKASQIVCTCDENILSPPPHSSDHSVRSPRTLRSHSRRPTLFLLSQNVHRKIYLRVQRLISILSI